jgi:hypothetical protein
VYFAYYGKKFSFDPFAPPGGVFWLSIDGTYYLSTGTDIFGYVFSAPKRGLHLVTGHPNYAAVTLDSIRIY